MLESAIGHAKSWVLGGEIEMVQEKIWGPVATINPVRYHDCALFTALQLAMGFLLPRRKDDFGVNFYGLGTSCNIAIILVDRGRCFRASSNLRTAKDRTYFNA